MTAYFDMPIFKTIDECAQMTKLPKYRIRQFVLNDQVKFIRFGRKYMVNVESLIHYLNGEDTDTKVEKKKEG